jgi:nitrate reductase gamma subunit
MATMAFVIFICGSCFRLFGFYHRGTNPKLLYPKENLTNGIKAVILGLIPFATRFMRERPVFTLITVLFHICLIILPLFLLAHIVLWFESYGLIWSNIPDGLADAMTLYVLVACLFLFVRRLMVPHVRMVSQVSDYLILIAVFISFLTGFLAFHQTGHYRPILILHILTSEILIAMIPFSSLMHMIVYPFSRYYMGADFGNVLKQKDW